MLRCTVASARGRPARKQEPRHPSVLDSSVQCRHDIFRAGSLCAVAQAGSEGEPRLTARGRATKARILGAADQLTYEKGVAQTTLEDVTTASGTSKSQL